ncbi:hypothetical protein [Mycobacterium dioxanotrophicus]|jgi:hypothetical protein|nr:hypothetical protein [Mycobacterium dioxanotrophicus]
MTTIHALLRRKALPAASRSRRRYPSRFSYLDRAEMQREMLRL